MNAASDKQISFIKSLANDKDASGLSDGNRGALADVLAGETIPKNVASDLIGLLLNAPRNAAAVAVKPTVADGRYAVEFEDTLRFFKVNTPDSGRWAGFTFVDEQASDDLYPVRNRERRSAILAAIAADSEALARYGKALGVCGVCNRTLTDETSRALGIGPVCREK